jgi:2,4-dienoyl-CoA reductase-like NADH-dependent reductase (Old Yellow Enzyme family)
MATPRLFSKSFLKCPSSTLELSNRIVVAPMCQYSARNGEANDWHLSFWTNMMNSGAGIFISEATAVSPEGRISPACLGIWDDVTQAAFGDKLKRARKWSPSVAFFVQLAHAGRKASTDVPWNGGGVVPMDRGGWETVAPSAVPHYASSTAPHELSLEELEVLKEKFVLAARRAQEIGVDGIEIHNAHGYLLHQFLSPLSNFRTDNYGGSLEKRMAFPLELFAQVRKAYHGVLGLRLSAVDWVEGGWSLEDSVAFALELKKLGCDFIHVSSGGVSADQRISAGANYQVPFAKEIKLRTNMPTITVGMITNPHQAEAILQNEEADFVALARAFLYNPRWGWEAAAALGGKVEAMPQFWRCLPREAKDIFMNMNVKR